MRPLPGFRCFQFWSPSLGASFPSSRKRVPKGPGEVRQEGVRLWDRGGSGMSFPMLSCGVIPKEARGAALPDPVLLLCLRSEQRLRHGPRGLHGAGAGRGGGDHGHVGPGCEWPLSGRRRQPGSLQGGFLSLCWWWLSQELPVAVESTPGARAAPSPPPLLPHRPLIRIKGAPPGELPTGCGERKLCSHYPLPRPLPSLTQMLILPLPNPL